MPAASLGGPSPHSSANTAAGARASSSLAAAALRWALSLCSYCANPGADSPNLPLIASHSRHPPRQFYGEELWGDRLPPLAAHLPLQKIPHEPLHGRSQRQPLSAGRVVSR